MKMLDRKDWPVLFVDDELGQNTAEGAVLRAIVKELEENLNCTIIDCLTCKDALEVFTSHPEIGCVVLEWEVGGEKDSSKLNPYDFIKEIRLKNSDISILLITEKLAIPDLPIEVLEKIDGYVWKTEDTPAFIAGRIEKELDRYIDEILPPFFKALVKYGEDYKYAWHTPGHMGGVAFLKTPAGRAMHKFFGENLFRTDLSVSVPELGSLLDHEGVVAEAEQETARVFDADDTFYVLNGTSTANQIVWHARVTHGETALVDRNCHKSLNYAMLVTGANPIYLMPSRNPYGTIGPIHYKEFDVENIKKKIQESPLIKDEDKGKKIKMSAVTNSTYDGLCYNVIGIKDKLAEIVENLHFDEAWYAYARFHPLYENHYGMTRSGEKPNHPPVFATHSTHKLMAAFSQASRIHGKNGGNVAVDHDLFNEAYMLHGSTSPNYTLIASLDVATRMVKGAGGRHLMNDTIEEAIIFRKKMAQVAKKIATLEDDPNKWWFTAWQPEKVDVKKNGSIEVMDFEHVDTDYLMNNQKCWVLNPGDSWHGFDLEKENYIMLDPIKVTIATPGIDANGKLGEWGIPASVVTNYLITKGVVAEKTGHYSWLMLFSMGTTKGKSGTLLAEMFKFKRLFDANAAVAEVLPDLAKEHPDNYGEMGIKDLCLKMHDYLRDEKIVETMLDCFDFMPEQVMKPADAYSELVRGNVEYVHLKDMKGRIPAVMVVPYPPGIPIIMEGERFSGSAELIVDYLQKVETFEYEFPGFEGDIHGVVREEGEMGRQYFKIYCLTE